MARAAGVPQQTLVAETARALAGFAGDELGLVTACRRVVHRHPTCGSLVWLATRAVTSPDPRHELREAAAAVAADPTGRLVAELLPPDAAVVVVGWPEVAVSAFGRRGDLSVVAVDIDGDAADLVDALLDADVAAEVASPVSLGAALDELGGGDRPVVVIIEADAVDATRAVAGPGSLAAAATAAALGIEVWLVAARGRSLPTVVLDAAVGRLDAGVSRWAGPPGACWDLVPTRLVDRIVRPDGAWGVAEALAVPDCAAVPELFAGDVF